MYKMIKLPYSYDAFEPIISKETMKNHYEILYKGYTDKFNSTLSKINTTRTNNNYNDIKCLKKELSFQGAGTILHEMFFENITPLKKRISKELIIKINNDFGNINNFINEFIESGSNIEGSGWIILGYTKTINKLIILQCEKHQNLSIWDFEPIIIIDVWEHAYYLDYQTKKKDYLKNIFEFINWEIASNRFKNCLTKEKNKINIYNHE